MLPDEQLPMPQYGALDRPAWLPPEASITRIFLVPDCMRDDYERSSWCVTVEWSGSKNGWIVGDRWDDEPVHATLDTALARAAEILPVKKIMGRTAAEAMAWKEKQRAETERTRAAVTPILEAARLRVRDVVAPDLVWVNERAQDKATRVLAAAGWRVTGTLDSMTLDSVPAVGLRIERTETADVAGS